MIQKRYFLFLLAIILLSIYGCAGDKNNKCSIKVSSLIKSQKIYVLVGQDVDPIEEIITNLAIDIRLQLLRKQLNAVIIHTESEANDDGVLVMANVVRVYKVGLAKRIEVEYRVIDIATKAELHRNFESIYSKFGYRKVSNKLGALISEGIVQGTLRDSNTGECM